MKPCNQPIYHCQNCGAVIRQEPLCVPPFCCGHEVIKAGEETLRDDFARVQECPAEHTAP